MERRVEDNWSSIGEITMGIAKGIADKAGVSEGQARRALIEGVLQKALERSKGQSIQALTIMGEYEYPKKWVLYGGTHPYADYWELEAAEKAIASLTPAPIHPKEQP